MSKNVAKRWLFDGHSLVLIVVALGWFFAYGTRMVYPVLVEYIRADFLISNTIIGLLFSLLMAFYALMQFPSGILGDRLGERTILVSSLIVSLVGLVFLTVSPIFSLFALGCVIFGLGTGLYSTPQFSILSKEYPERAATVHGIAYAAGSFGTFLLPVIAGYIALHASWRIGFGFSLPFVLLVIVGYFQFVPTQEPNQSNSTGVSYRKLIRRILTDVREPTVFLPFVALLLVAFPFQGLTAFLPTYLSSVKGATSFQATLLFGLFFVAGTVSQIAFGNLADRFDQTLILFLVAILTGGALFSIAISTSLVLVALLILPLSTINAYISLGNTYLVEVLPDASQGGGLGLLRTFIIGVGAISPVSLGYFIDAGRFTESMLVYVAFISLGAVLTLYIKRVHTGCE